MVMKHTRTHMHTHTHNIHAKVELMSLESCIVSILGLVVHDELPLHKVEAVRLGLKRCCNDVMLCTKPAFIVFIKLDIICKGSNV